VTKTAFDIYQDYLDRTSVLLMQNDHDAIAKTFAYPNHMETLDGIMTLNTTAEAVQTTQAFRSYLQRMGASDFFRICRGAVFSGEGDSVITGTHESYILRGATYMVEPYTNEVTFVLQDGQWLEQKIRTLAENVTVPILNPEQLRERALAKLQEIEGKTSND